MGAAGPDDPMVLHVLEAIEGGTARHLVDVTRHVQGFRHEVATPRRRIGRASDTTAPATATGAMVGAGAVVHYVDMRRLPVHPANPVAVVQLRRLMRRRRPSIVHVHSSLGGALGRAAATGLPVRRVYTPHGIDPGAVTGSIERLLGRVTDRLVAVSPSEAERFRHLRLAPPERIVIIRNGIDLSPGPPLVDLRALAGVPPGAPLVGSVSRLVPEKAPDDFVKVCCLVAARRPDVHFLLVGGGPGQRELDDLVRSSALGDRFHQLAAVAGLGDALGAFDVMVQPSRREAGPYSPLEGMRAGVPVVLSDAVGNRDVIEPGKSGRLRAVGDVAGMAEDVIMLLSDESQRRDIVAEAHRRLALLFDVRRMAAELAALYDEVLRGG